MSTVSTKPYLLRAIWEWCIDQGFTPYVATLVDENTRVPPGYARDGQIVLNLSPDATGQLQMANDYISFQARFGGAAHSLVIPVENVIAIYARENGQGMAFEPAGMTADEDAAEEGADEVEVEDMADATTALARDADPVEAPEAPPRPPRGSHLKV
ncbi:MAG: ClpXP protease specificity-enhancing factor, partial [Thauera sp.]